jgi:D-galactarolactone cycloisomerase
MKITDVTAHPISHVLEPGSGPRLGIGQMVKRDAVLVRVVTDDGVVGWGEAHHGRAPGAVARLVDATLGPLVVGMDALDVVGVWDRLLRAHFVSHGLGAGTAIGMSGIDMALWDVRGKAIGCPLHRLLGGGPRPSVAYAGGLTLGFQAPAALVEEASSYVEAGYRAIKLRLGDDPSTDLARVRAVREALGDGVDILTDANASYRLDDVRTLLGGLDDARVGWLEEPFAPFDHQAYATAAGWGRTPLAAGENLYTRFEFAPVLEAGVVRVLQPDLSKAGGVTEVWRIAAMASARRALLHPHTSMTALNMAATLHLLAAIDNNGYFEADATAFNPFRTELTSWAPTLDGEGAISPPEGPGLGLSVDDSFVAAHPLVDGPCYV